MTHLRWLGGLLSFLIAASAAAQSSEQKPQAALGLVAGGFYADSWALVIGINKYQRIPGLTYAVADATAVADALPAFGFRQQNIRLLLDEQATKARIENVLIREFAAMGDQDRLFVFFAGHGETVRIKGGEEGYLLPTDADPQALSITAIAMGDIKRIGQRVKAKHVLFVTDACFSGFAVTRDITPQSITDEYLAVALREPVVQVLTAGRKGERAIEEGGHGLFTRRFLDGLRGLADPDGRGIITAHQLAAWIEPRVVRDSGGKMTPQYGKLDGEGEFVFVRPAAQIGSRPQFAITREQEQGSLSIRSNRAGVEVWLDRQRVGETEVGITLVVSNVAVGVHRITARKAGFKEWEREIRITAKERTEVPIDLESARLLKTIDSGQISAKFGIPLPPDAGIVAPDASVSAAASSFLGMWFGTWDGNKLDHILVVEEIEGNTARVIYATGDSSAWRLSRSFSRVTGRFEDNGQTLVVELRRPATVTYRMRRSGKLDADYRWSQGYATVVMTKIP